MYLNFINVPFRANVKESEKNYGVKPGACLSVDMEILKGCTQPYHRHFKLC